MFAQAGAPAPRALTVGWILAGVLGLFLVLSAGVYASAVRLDGDSRVRGETLVANGLALRVDELRRVLAGSTNWDDAVIHLDNRFDPAWADTNVGQYFWKTDGYELTFVLGPDDRPIYASDHGDRTASARFGPMLKDLSPLFALIRAKEAARGAMTASDKRIMPSIDSGTVVRSGADVYFMVASLVQPDHNSHAAPGRRAPIVVIGQRVDQAFIADLRRRYLLDGLVLETPGQAIPTGYDSVPLGASDAVKGYRLAWKAPSPVRSLLTIAGLPLAAIFLALGLTPLVIIRVERSNRALFEASRDAQLSSAAKTAFLSTMSHEVRTPLNGMLGMAQAILHDDLPERQRERVKVVQSSGVALLSILNDVLDLSKFESGELTLELRPFDLDELVEAARVSFTGMAGPKPIVFRLVIDEAARGVYEGDLLRIRQVLTNLISNAVKFTEVGEIVLTITYSAEGLKAAVSDTGAGIAPGRIDALFERFVQEDSSTTRRYGGSGLGLAICRDLCTAMGGSITAQSAKGSGSCFTIILPLRKLAAGAVGSEPHAAAAIAFDQTPDRSMRVLVVEDNAVNQLVLSTLLQQVGIDPRVVWDGAEALAAWRDGEWDLILMDVQMPVMDGPTASRRIRRLEVDLGRRRTPIFALTANVMGHQTEAYIEAGMDGHIAKPIVIAELYKALEWAMAAPRDDAGPDIARVS